VHLGSPSKDQSRLPPIR